MKVLIILLLTVSFLAFPVDAAKPRVRTSGTKSAGAVATGYSRAKLSRATNSVVVTFINLGSVSRVTYTLSYTANGVDQGAMGSLVPSGVATETRDLYFGTCSHGVCTPHRGIRNAVLLVETQLTSLPAGRQAGRTNTKRYRIRI